jgi:RNA polymerase II-associated factor 1
LEKGYKSELLTEADLGVKIDLINPDTYHVDSDAKVGYREWKELIKWTNFFIFQLDKLDEQLIEEEPIGQKNVKRCVVDFDLKDRSFHCRSQQHSKVVPWMRKTEYISSEFNRLGTSSDRQETKVGYNIKKRLENDNIYRDRASQIEAINRTFDEVPFETWYYLEMIVQVAKPVEKHYSKPGVSAVQEMVLLPDFEVLLYPLSADFSWF